MHLKISIFQKNFTNLNDITHKKKQRVQKIIQKKEHYEEYILIQKYALLQEKQV